MKRIVLDPSKVTYDGKGFTVVMSEKELTEKFKSLQEDISNQLCDQENNEEVDQEVEDYYNEHWKSYIENPDGSLNLNKIKNELFDYHDLANNLCTIYYEITGHRLSYPDYTVNSVLSAHDLMLEDLKQMWEEDYREENECTCGLKEISDEEFDNLKDL